MYFNKSIIIFVVLVFITISEAAVKRKAKKIRKCNYSKVPAPPCICQNPVLEVINCACRNPSIESAIAALAPFDLTTFQNPINEIPNYRPEPVALNPLRCLFPSIEMPNFDAVPIAQSTEYYSTLELPCECPSPKCGCRSPRKLPAYEEYVTTIEVPNCGCQNIQISGAPSYYAATVIDIPSYGPTPVIQIPEGCLKPVGSCGCQSPCSCPRYAQSSCGCQESCSCVEYQILPCGCQESCSCPISSCGCQNPCTCASVPKSCVCPGSCSCPGYAAAPCSCQEPCSCVEYQNPWLYPGTQVSTCGCQNPCTCASVPKSCACQGSCSCPGYAAAPCSCQEPCSCAEYQNPWLYPGTQVPTCGCQNPCGCAGIPKSCVCQGPCGCSGVQATVALLPNMEPSCGSPGPCQCPGIVDICGCGISGCNCGQSIRQITLQPPYL